MTLQEIKTALSENKRVLWSNESYCVKQTKGDYVIEHVSGHRIGLTWDDGVTLNGKEEDFYIQTPAK